jgi:uncharacterized SAM-binding protein YcdF (DUF218 family)
MMRRVRGIFCVLLAAGLLAVVATSRAIICFPSTITSGAYDCAIVLGAAVHGSKPSPVFQARIDHAIDLHQKGIVSHIIFTGGKSAHALVAESEAAQSEAQARGVPAASILIEALSRTTLQNLRESSRLMQTRHLKSAVIVSDPLHLRRGCTMAADLGIQAVPSATPATRYQTWRTRLPFLIRETYFTLHYHLFKQ